MTSLSIALRTAAILLVPATVMMFAAGERRHQGANPLDPFLSAVAVGFGAILVSALLGASPTAAVVVAACLAVSVLVWRPGARDWAMSGIVSWALALATAALYLAYVLAWTFTAGLTAFAVLGSLVLWLVQLLVALVGVGYAWELVDVLARRRDPSALVDTRSLPSVDKAHRPFVSLHVPTHNEPADLVIATLERLLALDYQDYEIIVVDTNTTDERLWRPVSRFCADRPRVTFVHIDDWPGYKAGALNLALRRTDTRAEAVGVVDVDTLAEPDWLAECAPLFADPGVTLVRTPRECREWEGSAYFQRLYHAGTDVLDVGRRAVDQRTDASLDGTMCLVRRDALDQVDGWNEWCTTEDAELSLRLLRAGGRQVQVMEPFAQAVMPVTFEALKRQRFRRCFGGVQLLRLHWRELVPGRTDQNTLTPAQRWAHVVGGLHWFGDLAGVVFTGFLVLGGLDAALGEGMVIRRLSGPILLMAVVLVGLRLLCLLAILRRSRSSTWRHAAGALRLDLALGWTVAQATVHGLIAEDRAFLHTTATSGEPGWQDSVRGNAPEVGLAAACVLTAILTFLAGGVGAAVVGLLLLLQGSGYAAAPVLSLGATRADLPEALVRRRRRESRRSGQEGRPAPNDRPAGVLTMILLAALVVVASGIGGPDLFSLPGTASVRSSEISTGKGTASPSSTSTVLSTTASTTATPVSTTATVKSSSTSTSSTRSVAPKTTTSVPASTSSSPGTSSTTPVVISTTPAPVPTKTKRTGSPTTHPTHTKPNH